VFKADSWVAMICNNSQLDSLISEYSVLIANNRLVYRPIKIELTYKHFNSKYTVILNCVMKNFYASFLGKAALKAQPLSFNSIRLITLLRSFYGAFITFIQNRPEPLIYKIHLLLQKASLVKKQYFTRFYIEINPSSFLPLPTIQTGDAQWL